MRREVVQRGQLADLDLQRVVEKVLLQIKVAENKSIRTVFRDDLEVVAYGVGEIASVVVGEGPDEFRAVPAGDFLQVQLQLHEEHAVVSEPLVPPAGRIAEKIGGEIAGEGESFRSQLLTRPPR